MNADDSNAIEEERRERQQQREFFDMVAVEKGFDPLVAANWYPLAYHHLDRFKVNLLSFTCIMFYSLSWFPHFYS